MLIQRVITALILLPIAMAGLFLLEPAPFSYFVASIVALAAWEWGRLAGLTNQLFRVLYAIGVVGLIVIIGPEPSPVLVHGALLWWFVSLALVLSFPRSGKYWDHVATRMLIGVYILVPFWAGLVTMRGATVSAYPDLSALWLIFYTLFVVFAADTGAYFSGKAWGKSKLAPNVSPGKSWAGFWGGMALACSFSLIAGFQLDASAGIYIQLMVLTAVTSIFSVVGDLTESMFKRQAGVKDSSRLLPGHGGVLDRIDSLTAAFPVMASLLLLSGWMH